MLAVTYGLPWPLTEGAKIRDFHLLREAAKETEVVLLSFCKDDPDHPEPDELRKFCAAVETYAPPQKTQWANAVLHARSGRPWATYPFYFEEFAQRIRALALSHRVDLVQIEHSFLAPYRTAIPDGCRAILSLHNIGETQYSGMVKLSGAGLRSRLKAAAMRGWEADWARRFDHCLTVSADEAAWVRQRAPQVPVSVLENGVDCARLQPLPPPPAANHILFVGALGYPPNADAVIHFTSHVLPLLRRSVPEVKLVAVGRNPRADVKTLASKAGVELHEDVPDVIPFYRRASACVVPLRAGGGTRLKILEAMALGRPVISTSKGCEGLALAHENQLLIADEPADMAQSVERVLRNPNFARELAERARQWVEARHDWRALGVRLRQVHREVTAHSVEAVS